MERLGHGDLDHRFGGFGYWCWFGDNVAHKFTLNEKRKINRLRVNVIKLLVLWPKWAWVCWLCLWDWTERGVVTRWCDKRNCGWSLMVVLWSLLLKLLEKCWVGKTIVGRWFNVKRVNLFLLWMASKELSVHTLEGG